MKGAYTGYLKARKVPPTTGPWPQAKRKRRQSLLDLAVMQIEEATNYDKDDEIIDPVELIREFKRHPQFCEELRKLTEIKVEEESLTPEERANLGRRRMPVRWDLLYLAFVASRDPAPWSFRKRWASSPIWQECGFDRVPHYNTINTRFKELEEKVGGFKQVKQLIVRQAKRHRPEIGRFDWFDFTGYQSNARIHHAPPEICEKCADAQAAAEKAGEKWRRPGRFLNRMDAASFEKNRSEEAEEEEFEKRGKPRSSLTSLGVEIVKLDGKDREVQLFEDGDGHILFSFDTECGVRKYKDKRSWHGGLGGGFVDVLTGVAIAIDAIRADDAEFNHYPELFDDLVASIGELPVAVSIDRGNAVRDFYEFNTRRGVGTIGPRRVYENKATGPDWRTELFDEHGHPRCPNCNGEGVMDKPNLGWYLDRSGEPRLRFRCATPYEDDCKGTHSIACSEEWLLLQPLAITDPLYQSVKSLHKNLERIWHHYRQRYAFAGKDTTGRLKRLGVEPQRLRGNAAILIDWFRVSLRHGWLGSWRTQNPDDPQPVSATGAVEAIQKIRRARGLDVPYGKRWERLKERMQKRRRKPHTHGPAASAVPPPVQPPDPPPEKASGQTPKIWLPPPDLGRR